MILPEKSSGISLSCQTLRRSPSCPLFRRSSTCSLWHFHIPTLSEHSSSIPASEKSASHGKLHGDTLSDHNPSVGITQIRYGRRSIFLSACHTSSRWLFFFSVFQYSTHLSRCQTSLPGIYHNKSYFEISSIRRSSSAVNGAQWIAFTLSRICCGLEAPIRTLVTSLC